jgi:MFS family permease
VFIGSIFGLVLMNLVSDRYGRKTSYLISLYLCLLGAILITAGAMSKNVPLIMAGQFLSGFGSCSCYTLALVLISDFSGEVFR